MKKKIDDRLYITWDRGIGYPILFSPLEVEGLEFYSVSIDSLQSIVAKYKYLPKPSARAGYETRSIFKRNLTGLNSEFSF